MLVSTIIFIVLMIIGIVMIITALGNFSDKSYPVTVGIGFIVWNIIIYGLSRAVGIAQMRKEGSNGKVDS
ncbi:hypothetical protein [Saccharibacillus sacchari]|uniref:Uncharacterized protein n=1 Tax=Saccharibacillus sacchari TaxID=456493 RepID=A0ACC6PGA9_9BACL